MKNIDKTKIGLQVLAYNCATTFQKVIDPWISLRKEYDIKIWVGSGQFKEYAELGYENLNYTTEIVLNIYKECNKIDYLFSTSGKELLTDAETRDKCIPWMKENDIELMIQVDADEYYSSKEAKNLIEYAINNPDYTCYNTIFNNIIGDGDIDEWSRFSAGWIKKHGGIRNYYFDCHWCFNDDTDYRSKKMIDIPKELVNPNHYTWTNNENTTGPAHVKDKIEYQKRIYNDGCGYEWDEVNQKIKLNG